jgi:hypothetical protein
MNVVLMTFLNKLLDGMEWAQDHMPSWAIYLILLALSMAAWYGVALACASIARSMT